MDDDDVVNNARQSQRFRSHSADLQRHAVTLGIDQYFWVLRRQWVLIGLFIALGIAAAGAYLMVTPQEVVATTKLNLNVIMTEPFSSQRPASGLLDGATEADIARSHVVALRAAEILGGTMPPAEIRTSSEITSGVSATVVEIEFTASTKDQAIEGANAVANAYLGFRSNQADQRVSNIVETLTSQIDDLNLRLNETNETIANTSDTSTQHIQAVTQQQQVLTELDGLLSERNALRSVDTTGGLVLSGAETNEVSYLPSTARTILLGSCVGLVLGVIAAFLRNPFDRRVKSAKEMSWLLHAPVLTEVPGQSRSHGRASTEGLRVAQQRILTSLKRGDTILLLDTTNSDKPSLTTRELEALLEDTGLQLNLLMPCPDDPAALIAGLRAADAAVVIFDRTSARTRQMRWFSEESLTNETPVLGIIECSAV